MKDKYLGIIALTLVCLSCIVFKVGFAKEVVLMSVPVIAAVIRD